MRQRTLETAARWIVWVSLAAGAVAWVLRIANHEWARMVTNWSDGF